MRGFSARRMRRRPGIGCAVGSGRPWSPPENPHARDVFEALRTLMPPERDAAWRGE